MSDASITRPLDTTRPPGEAPAAALPLEAREGVAPVTVRPLPATEARLATGVLWRTVASLAIPSVASMLLMTLFFSADAYWVGTRIGPRGLAAVSTSAFWVWQIVSVAELVSVGLTAVAARRHGERQTGEAARVVGDALLLALALGVAVAALGLLLLDWMFAVMHTPPEVTAEGRNYLGTYLAGSPLIFGFFAVDAAFRAAGDTRTPFLLLLGSVAVALALDPVLVLGLGPAPELGITGAAVATIAPRGAVFVLGLALLARRSMIRLGRPRAAPVLRIVRIGLPTALTGIVFSNIYVLLTRTTTRFGTPALAALGVGHRVESWAYMIGVGFGAAAAAIVGQNLGARDVKRAERAGWLATGFATVVSAVGALLEYMFAEEFAGFFTNDPAVIAEGAFYLRIVAVSTLFIGAELVLEGSLGGAGATLPPMLTSTALTALRVPLAAWAAPIWGTAGIWWTLSLTSIARGAAMMLLWRSGLWKRKSL